MGLGLMRGVTGDGEVTAGLSSDGDLTGQTNSFRKPAWLVCSGGLPYMQFQIDASATGGGIIDVLSPIPTTWTEETEYCASQEDE